MKAFSLICLLSFSASNFANSAILAQWTFETSLPTTAGPLTPEVGSGAALGFHSTASTYSNPVGNGSAESFSSTNWSVGDYYQFLTSSIGQESITISFDHVSSATGPRDFQLSYSTNGTAFTDFGSAYVVLVNTGANTWGSSTAISSTTYSFDLSSVTALDNAATIYFRITQTTTVSANGGTVAVGGTSRVDNFTINAVPEPGVALLGSLGLLTILRRRR